MDILVSITIALSLSAIVLSSISLYLVVMMGIELKVKTQLEKSGTLQFVPNPNASLNMEEFKEQEKVILEEFDSFDMPDLFKRKSKKVSQSDLIMVDDE